MSEKELCWKCREIIKRNWAQNSWYMEWTHCHHEPKEKEKCWCETWTFPETINLKDSGNRMLKPKFCPECGKPLK